MAARLGGSDASTKAAAHRRKRGSGGVIPIRAGVWRIDIEGKRDPVTGKRRRISRQVHGTREEAELALAKLRVADHEKRLPSGGTNARSVAAAFEQYLQAVESGVIELSPSTVVTVRSAAKVVGATVLADGRQFGGIRLGRLTWQDIEDLYAAMRKSGKSAAYIRRCATILARTLELARKRGLIESNPTKDATRPRTSRTKPFAPTADQVREVLDRVATADAEIGRAGVVFASTGMRRGELLGLQWGDVDLTQAEVHVAHAVTDGGRGVGVVRKSTKRSDWRDVPLTTGAMVGAMAAAPAVNKGDAVSIAVTGDGFTVSQPGEALEGGPIGGWIRVRPVKSGGAAASFAGNGETLRAQVVRPGTVAIPLP